MRLFKVKLQTSPEGKLMQIVPKDKITSNWALEIRAIFYGGEMPDKRLRLMDSDKDEFLDLEGSIDPKAYILPSPMIVTLPVLYKDEDIDGDNKLIIWGRLVPIKRLL